MTGESIRDLFSNPAQVERVIKKVIDYQHSDPQVLADEIREYVVTGHIEENFRKALEWLDVVNSGNGAEVGAWVSGFYGSGKSSFTKYLGFAFDRTKTCDGRGFAEYLADQIEDKAVAQQLKTAARRMDAAVVMLDLATQTYSTSSGLMGATETLYRRVLDWAGLSNSPSIAAIELKVREDGRWDELNQRCQALRGKSWTEVHKKGFIARSALKQILPEMYPGRGYEADDDKNLTVSAEERARQIIEIVRKTGGREYVIFVIDEVGNFIASDPSKIQDMQGLVQNLKTFGEGKVVVFATAQQMLTETNQAAAINSPLLYKLKDRFSLQLTLESDDIKEICYRRLLKKSPKGEEALRSVYRERGPKLIAATRLTDSKAFEKGLTEEQFVNLYPFLPSHFEILISLLSELSRTTGGIGLRSAIKIVQDILTGGGVNGAADESPLRSTVGRLVTAADFYDDLKADIDRTNKPLYMAAQKVIGAYEGESPLYAAVAKALAVAQLLKDFKATPANIAALLQGSVEADVAVSDVESVLRKLSAEPTIPVSFDSGDTYRYMNEQEESLDKQRREYVPPPSDVRNREDQFLKDLFRNQLSVQAIAGLACNASLWRFGIPVCVAGNETDALRLEIVWQLEGETLEAKRSEALAASLEKKNAVFLVAEKPRDFDSQLLEILRSEYMGNTYSNRSNQFEAEFGRKQKGNASEWTKRLSLELKDAFAKGWIVARGVSHAAGAASDAFDAELKARMKALAGEVFQKHGQVAAALVRSGGAARVLGAAPMKPLEAKDDPLKLVKTEGGALALNHEAAAESVLQTLDRGGEIRGNALLEEFSRAPYGWGKDVTLYVVAALFVCAEIELNISGHVYRVREDAVESVFASPRAFGNVGVRRRIARISQEQLVECGNFLASQGELGIDYAEGALTAKTKSFAGNKLRDAQGLSRQIALRGVYGRSELGQLELQLKDLKDEGLEKLISLLSEPDSSFKARMEWFASLKKAESNGLFEEIEDVLQTGAKLSDYKAEAPAKLLAKFEELKAGFSQKSFGAKLSDYRQFVSEARVVLERITEDYRRKYAEQVSKAQAEFERVVEIYELTEEEQQELPPIPEEHLEVEPEKAADPARLENAALRAARVRGELEPRAKEIVARRVVAVKTPRTLRIPARISSAEELGRLIGELKRLEAQMGAISEIDVKVE